MLEGPSRQETGLPAFYEERLRILRRPQGGGGGNRTRVRRQCPRSSPGAACYEISRPQRSHRQVADGLSHLGVPVAPVTWATSSGSLDDARNRVESYPGLTDFGARSGGEGEVGALGVGTYGFAWSVDEITMHPRPASPGTTTIVETDHPLCSCQPPDRIGEPPRSCRSSVRHNAGPVAPIPGRGPRRPVRPHRPGPTTPPHPASSPHQVPPPPPPPPPPADPPPLEPLEGSGAVKESPAAFAKPAKVSDRSPAPDQNAP